MGKYYRDDGFSTNETDPERMIWDGQCTFWTDDWSKVKKADIPCCTNCSAVGHMTTAKNWFEGVDEFVSEGNPDYRKFIDGLKNKCMGRGVTTSDAWRSYQEKVKAELN